MRFLIQQRTWQSLGFLCSYYLPSTKAICTGPTKGTSAGPRNPGRSARIPGSAGDQTTQWPRARARSRGMCTTWIAHWGVLDIASRCPEGSWRKKTALGSGRPPEWAARARASLTQGGQRTAGAGPSRRDSRGGEPWGPSRPPRAGSEPRPRPGPLGCRLLAEFCLLANPHGRRGPHPGCGGPGRGAAEVRSPGNRAGTLSGWSCNGLLTQPLVQISGSLSWAGSAQLPHSRPDPCFQPV